MTCQIRILLDDMLTLRLEFGFAHMLIENSLSEEHRSNPNMLNVQRKLEDATVTFSRLTDVKILLVFTLEDNDLDTSYFFRPNQR